VEDTEARKRFVAGVFDRASATYDRTGVEFAGTVARTLVERAGLRPGEQVLELGCGRGAATVPAAERVGSSGRVLALDLAEGMVTRTRAEVAAAGLHQVTCELGDAEDPQVDPGSWDVVLASLVLFFLPRAEDAMRSYRRLLRPGGRLALSWFAGDDPRWDPVFESLLAEVPEDQRGPRRPGQEGPFRSREAMDAFLVGAGYRPVTVVEPVTVRYPNPATWWTDMWSHGRRAMAEKLRDLGVLESTMARTTDDLEALRGPDGALEWVPQMGYTVAAL
jgi:ubiquinone/menaquinone biosynthesis C-methylase UbiE